MRSRQLRQASICQFSTSSWSFAEDIARYISSGYQSAGIWRRKIHDFGIDRAIDLIHEHKVSVSSVHWAGGFTGDGHSFQHAIDDSIDAIRLAARVNANCLLIHPGARNGHITSHINGVLRLALDQLIPVANDHGVRLAVEPIPGQPDSPWTFHTTIDETLTLLSDYPALRLVLDLYHVGFESEVYERIPEFADRIQLVQIADRTRESWSMAQLTDHRRQSFRLPPGKGDIAIESWLARLNAYGYLGPMEIEVHGREVQDGCHFELLDETSDFLQSTTIRHATDPITARQADPNQRVIN